ncbi:MarR family winged helix-turn-helix transcriptional regulator [Desulfospira joergensenii]|uniref:MarR family winged helix-turn-helix transcriptional regulator n=1 Tax=Desulfospira joergensenii TaxID=53329 RepID=UPI0003B2FF96|nr:MarR family transcriptional regulator [Desulfospira joergensenii]
MSYLPDDVPDCMVFLLGKAYQKAHARFKSQLIPYGLTNLQHLVLEGLWYKQGMTAAQLGKFLILDKATLSGVLDRMASNDWILKKPHPEDRRTLSLFTSPKADGLKEKLIQERIQANEQILKAFSLEEKLLFKRLLTDVINSE